MNSATKFQKREILQCTIQHSIWTHNIKAYTELAMLNIIIWLQTAVHNTIRPVSYIHTEDTWQQRTFIILLSSAAGM